MTRVRIARIASFALLGLSASCNDRLGLTELVPTVASVTISTLATEIQIGGSSKFTAVVKDGAGNTLSGRAVSWSSANPLVATVSSSGIVRAIEVGTTEISAVSEGQTGALTATVTGRLPYGSIRGAVRDETGAAVDENASLQIVAVSTFGAGDRTFIRHTPSEDYVFGLLTPGRWTLRFSAGHAWSWVFPGLNVYMDTTVVVDVVRDVITVVPELLLRRRPSMVLAAIETCPWSLPDPPTIEDWWGCDGGYWGGVDAQITVKGVAGSNTASFSAMRPIGPAVYGSPPSFWENTPWSTHFDITVPGDYDVSIVLLQPSSPLSPWYVVPWQTTTRRVTVGRGLHYIEFDFWRR